MPLPLAVSCFSKIEIGFAFLVPAHPGSPGQRAAKRVCVCVCYSYIFVHLGSRASRPSCLPGLRRGGDGRQNCLRDRRRRADTERTFQYTVNDCLAVGPHQKRQNCRACIVSGVVM